MQRLWYVAYGSNLSLDRFRVYLQGGRPVGGARLYPGCRDSLGPEQDVPLMIPGGLRFVGVSSVWGGGMAVYDARATGEIAARAYLITAEQFVDVLAQEMRLEPDLDVNLSLVRETGWHSLGPGRYQTLAHVGSRDDLPMLTFTSADVDHRVNAPSEGYLRTIAGGLRESHGWTKAAIGRYLARFPGAAGVWPPRAIERLAA
ncbi:MAG TPA: histone deacetylase [Propionibacteriaceae bacterium]|nr:histone deacetylase [Propionibacteriaceae bacterium]